MADELGTLRGKIVLDVKQALGAYREVRQQHQSLIFSSRQVGDAFVQSGTQMLAGGTALLAGFGAAVNAAATFERKMDFFQAVSATSRKEMDELTESVLRMAQESIFSGGQVADGIVELGKAGVSARQIIDGVGDAVINLGAAGDIPLAQAGQIITSVVQQFDLAATDATGVADKLAGAANASIVEIDDLGVSLKYVGGVASAAGLSFEDVNDALGILGKAGIRGSTAGTSLRQMIVSLGGATKPARTALMELGILTEDGTNKFYDQEGALKPLSQVYQILQDSMDGLTQKQKLAYLRTIFNNRALSAAAILTREGAAGFKEMNGEISKTTAADVASKRLDNLSGDVEILKGNIETFMIKAGTPFQNFLRDITQALTAVVQFFGELPQPVQTATLSFIAIMGVMLILMGIFNIIVGTIINFAGNLARLAGAGGVVSSIFSGIAKVFAALILPLKIIANFAFKVFMSFTPWGRIISIVLLLVGAIVLAYKNSDRFRAIVDKVVQVLIGWGKAIMAFIQPAVNGFKKLLPTTDQIAAAIQKVGNYINYLKSLSFGGWVKEIGRVLGMLGQLILKGLGKALLGLGKLMLKVGGLILSGLGAALPKIGSFLLTMAGVILKFLITLPIRMAALAVNLVGALVGWLSQVGPKAAGYLGYLIGFILGFIVRMGLMILSKSLALQAAFLSWIIGLPGKILSGLTAILTTLAVFALRFISFVIAKAPGVINGFLQWVRSVPGAIGGFLAKLPGKIAEFAGKAKEEAIKFGLNMYNGISKWITSIPGLVGDIMGKAKQVIKDAISGAFNAMKDFGSNMWEGFKDGIGINSPSYVEKAMFALTENTQAETKKLARTTVEVQKLGNSLAATAFGPQIDLAAYQEVAKLQRSMKASDGLAQALGVDSDSLAKALTKNKANGPDKVVPVEGVMSLDENGVTTFKGWAREVYDGESDFENSIGKQ